MDGTNRDNKYFSKTKSSLLWEVQLEEFQFCKKVYFLAIIFPLSASLHKCYLGLN